jgi:capsular exopolysaccharide synthesis family protein
MDLQRYIALLIERRYVLLGFVAVGLILAFLWTASQPKVYEARAKVVFLSGQRLPGSGLDESASNYYMLQGQIQNSRQILVSDKLAKRVVKRLSLLQDRSFYMGADPPKQPQQAAEQLLGHYSADIIAETYVIAITARHQVPEWAKKIADAVAYEFVQGSEEERDTSTQSASQKLTDQLDETGRKLHEAELALSDFKTKHNLLSLDMQDQTNQLQRQINRFTDALTEIRLQKRARQSKLEQVQKFTNSADPLQVPTDKEGGTPGIIGDLRRVYTEESRRTAELRERYQDSHPLVRQQSAKVDEVLRNLQREIGIALRDAQRQYSEVVSQEQKVQADLEAVKQEALKLDRLSADFNRLKREAEGLKKSYSDLLSSTHQTGTAVKIRQKNIEVLDEARMPQAPVSPRLRVALLLGFVLSLILGVLLIFGIDALDRSVKSQEDVEARLGLPFLGMMPRMSPSDGAPGKLPDLYVSQHPRSTVAEACRAVRTNVLFAGAEQRLKKILVTSSVAREGKTLSCVSLGTVLAQGGARTIIIDCDLRRPRVAKAFGMRDGIGVTNVLLGEVEIEDAVRTTDIPNLWIMTSGPIPPNPAELLDGSHFRDLLERLAGMYDRVLIDSPPAVPVTDPAILSTLVDGVVLVVRHGSTPREAVRRASKHILDVGGRIIGVVLNDINTQAKGYRSYYGAYYHYYQSEYKADEEGEGSETASKGGPAPDEKRRRKSKDDKTAEM